MLYKSFYLRVKEKIEVSVAAIAIKGHKGNAVLFSRVHNEVTRGQNLFSGLFR
jgi:hypothetical protein